MFLYREQFELSWRLYALCAEERGVALFHSGSVRRVRMLGYARTSPNGRGPADRS